MAVLYIAEYARMGLAQGPGGAIVQVPEEPALAEQVINFTGTSAPVTNPFNVKTRFLRLHTDAICSVKFGLGTPVATTATQRLAAGATEYKGVSKTAVEDSTGMKVAAITNT